MLRDISPRCGKPVVPYEMPGRTAAGEYCGYGPLIRSAREASGMTPGQLAAAVGVHSARVVISWELEWSYPGRSAVSLERCWVSACRVRGAAGRRGTTRRRGAVRLLRWPATASRPPGAMPGPAQGAQREGLLLISRPPGPPRPPLPVRVAVREVRAGPR